MNQAQINTQNAASARAQLQSLTSRDVIQDLDQSIDMLEILWLALHCQGLHDAETVTRASTVLYSALEILKPLVRIVDAAGDDLHELRSDPILDAIWYYTQGCAAYDSVEEADKDEIGEAALVSKTYGPPMNVLDNWKSPALTSKGAREALRFALAEGEISCSLEPRIENMIRAAYDFYKSEGGVA